MLIVGGGQSGLAAARAGRDLGWEPVVLEAGPEPVGSWPRYYDSLRLFSPRRFSGFPGRPFPGPADGFPTRDEVVGYLREYAARLDADIRTNAPVTDVSARAGGGFIAVLADGTPVGGDALIAATGSFRNPRIPSVQGREKFGGLVLHVADYRSPVAFAAQRVIVVGAANSAVQVADELNRVADVTLATRGGVRFAPQSIAGRDLHWWLHRTRVDMLPAPIVHRLVKHSPVIDDGTYRTALKHGALDQRPMFSRFTADGVAWADGTCEPVDAVIYATGYRPHLPYLARLGALDADGRPRHRWGVSTAHDRLGFVGLEFQRSFASNSLRGVHRDAAHVARAITRSGAAT